MSRCFPYPPPGYVRTPVAVAEAESTAKLQKEKKRAEKKEKRSDRKALRQGETSKDSNSHKKRKHEDIGTTGQESKTASKESVEQLEKSGLSEEHGAPFFVQTVVHSPESSQDSSKRRKAVLSSPSQTKNGNILRIKIKRDQDSPKSVEQPSVVPVGLGVSQLSKPYPTQQNNKVNINSTAARHNRINDELQASTQLPPKYMRRDDPRTAKVEQPSAIQSGLGSSQLSKAYSTQQLNKVNGNSAAARHNRVNDEPQSSTQLPPKFTRRDDLHAAKVVQQTDNKLSVKPPVGRVDPPVVKMAQRDLPSKAVPAKVLQVPSAESQRKCPTVYPKVHDASTPAICHPENLQLQRPSPVLKEEPSSSGRNAEAVQRQEVKQSKSDRKKSRKAEKKEKKLRDLFVTWRPPSIEMEDSGDCAQDWLFGSTKNSDASMIENCRASDGSVLFHSTEPQPSLQPMATFLPDLHMYQLPYVVPF